MVKQRMRIPVGDTSRDAEIAAALTYGDAYCNGMIKAKSGSIPVASPDQTLKEAAADFAAFFIFRTDNPTVANLFHDSGKTLIQAYLEGSVTGFGAKISGKIGVRDED